MALRRLTDDTLESILWNKVPVELQKEVKDFTDGPVQALLQKLLKAKLVLQECKRRGSSKAPVVVVEPSFPRSQVRGSQMGMRNVSSVRGCVTWPEHVRTRK